MRAASSGVLAVMRKRNWLMGLAAPILAAIAVGIAVVVVAGGGGGGGAAPSALAAGFPPARLAGADFTGNAAAARVILNAIGASGGTEVAAGGANGGPALWVVRRRRVPPGPARALTGPASLTKAGSGQLAGVAHGPAGWLAVGTTLAGRRRPARGLLARRAHLDRDGRHRRRRNAVAAAVAAGPPGT